MIVARERHDRQEIRAFCELAVNLYDGTDVADRRRIACLAARASDIPAEFLEHAERDEILERLGLTPKAIARDIVAQVVGSKVPHAKPIEAGLPAQDPSESLQ